MLTASAPLSTAHTIERAMLESLRSVLAIKQPAVEPGAGQPGPVVGRRAGHRRDVGAVTDLVDRGRPSRAAASSWSTEATIRPANSGWAASMPVSMIATTESVPRVTSHAIGRPWRAAHHCSGVPGGAPDAGSGVLSAGSLGR